MQSSIDVLGERNAKLIFHRDVYMPDAIREYLNGNIVYVKGYTKIASLKDKIYKGNRRRKFHLDYVNVVEAGLIGNDIAHLVVKVQKKNGSYYYVIDNINNVIQNMWFEETDEKLNTEHFANKFTPIENIITASISKKAAQEVIDNFDGKIIHYVYGAIKKDDEIMFIIDWSSLPYMVKASFLEIKGEKVLGYNKKINEAENEFQRIFGSSIEEAFKNTDRILLDDFIKEEVIR